MNLANILTFLIESSIIFSLLFLFYYLFLRGHTFHQLNRFTLLLILASSIWLPFLEINTNIQNIQTPINIESLWIDEMDEMMSTSEITIKTDRIEWNWPFIIFNIWLLGSLFFTFRLMRFLMAVYRLKHNGKVWYYQQRKYYLVEKKHSPFSFFNWIFLPHDFDVSNAESILQHEQNHVKQLHSFDLIFTELLCIILWFNPFVFLFKSSIKTVHEFQVDALVCRNESKKTYMQLMMLNTEKLFFAGLSNHFNHLTIKKRIDMITKNNTPKIKGLFYLMFLPLLAVLSISFAQQKAEGTFIKIPEIESGIVYNVNDNLVNPPSLQPIRAIDLTRIGGFGMYTHPIYKIEKMHPGIDYSAPLGTEILASGSGTIIKISDKKGGYGKMVIIKHNNTFETRYAHMEHFIVEEGDLVKLGQVIGYVGNTGMSTGPHLHFEVRKNGKPVDPKDYLIE